VRSIAIFCAIVLVLAVLLQPLGAMADGRHRSEQRATMPQQLLLPAATAPSAQDAIVLSGLDYSAVAPPGVRLRVVEDEPYSFIMGAGSSLLVPGTSLTMLTLRADNPALDGVPMGFYEAHISLLMPEAGRVFGSLAQSFDTAAHSAYRHAMLRQDERDAVVYGIDEVRSPLGLVNASDKLNRGREFLAYSAVAINPNSEEGAVRRTPYQYIRGELRVLRRLNQREGMLCIRIEAQEFPQALPLTENLARCIINRLTNPKKTDQRLDYLVYYPESERAQVGENEVLDPRTADLAERPGEGCGLAPLPIQGDLCPQCQGDGPFAPARPYLDPGAFPALAHELMQAVCSHCLMGPDSVAGGEDSTPLRSNEPDKHASKDDATPCQRNCAERSPR
jgi:hypothetical protein